jgi:hypothetical protein
VRAEIELRGLLRFRVMDYLAQAGGEMTESLSVVGDGWMAYVVALESARVGVVDIPRDRLVIEGDVRAVERVYAFMYRKVRQMRRGR